MDSAGQRLTDAITDNTGTTRTEQYGYDELNRLTSVNYGDGQTQTYNFDPMGNRLQKADSVTGTENYTFNAANMLLTRGANNCTNDADGNTLTGGGRTNSWDSQNRMVQCVNGSNTSSYVYSVSGIRRRSIVNGTATDFALDGQSVVREMRAGTTSATYLTGGSGPMYKLQNTNGTIRWYLYDGLGSVLGEVDPSGNVTTYAKYDVYGGVRSRTGTATSAHGFVGTLGHTSEAETGLIFMRARYMDPVTGRFQSEDPARNGENWLGYASDSPSVYVDKSGRADEGANGGTEDDAPTKDWIEVAGEILDQFEPWGNCPINYIHWPAWAIANIINSAGNRIGKYFFDKKNLDVNEADYDIVILIGASAVLSGMLLSDILKSVGLLSGAARAADTAESELSAAGI